MKIGDMIVVSIIQCILLPLSICITMFISKEWCLNFIIEHWQWIVPSIILSIFTIVLVGKDKLEVENKFLKEIVRIIVIASFVFAFAMFGSMFVIVFELLSKGTVYLFSGWVPLDEIYDFVTNWWILIWYIPLWIIGQLFCYYVTHDKKS